MHCMLHSQVDGNYVGIVQDMYRASQVRSLCTVDSFYENFGNLSESIEITFVLACVKTVPVSD